MAGNLLPSEDILAAARDLVENHQPFQAYLMIRSAQLSVGEWAPPPLTKPQISVLKGIDHFLSRFPDA